MENKTNSGAFKKGDKRAVTAGKKGGANSTGKFKKGDKRAKDAGRKGGGKAKPGACK